MTKPNISLLTIDNQARAGFGWMTVVSAACAKGDVGDVWKWHRSFDAGLREQRRSPATLDLVSFGEAQGLTDVYADAGLPNE